LTTDQRVRRTRHLSLVARAGVAILAIVWVLRGQNWAELAGVFRRLDPWLFALALAIYGVSQLVIAFRWWVLLRALSIHIPVLSTLKLHFIGLFYNNVMPGSVGGDLLKAWYVAKHTHRRLEGALSVLVDRVVGLGGMLLMAVAAYLLFMRGQGLGIAAEGGSGSEQGLAQYGRTMLWAAVAVAAVVSVVLLHPRSRARVREAVAKAWQRGRSWFGRAKQALVVYCSRPLTMFYSLVLTIIGQSVVIIAFWLLGRNLAIAAGPRYYFVIFPVTWVIGAVPVSIAGLGVLEAGIVEMFVRMTAAAAESALALALCQRFIWVIGSLPGGLVHLVGGHLPKEFLVDGDGPLN
jgi:uncharacterized membrane protein YbhN (UPF0104 family)